MITGPIASIVLVTLLVLSLVRLRQRPWSSGRWTGWAKTLAWVGSLALALMGLTLSVPRLAAYVAPQPSAETRTFAHGVRYLRKVRTDPPQTAHVLTFDLGEPIVFLTTALDDRGELRAATPSEFARATGAEYVMNAGFFEPWRSRLFDYYPHSGDPVRPIDHFEAHFCRAADCPSCSGRGEDCVSSTGSAGRPAGDGTVFFHREPPKIRFGASGQAGSVLGLGGERILVAGETAGSCRDTEIEGNRMADGAHPRTALGVTADRSVMIWLVVDGRQRTRSRGATLPEVCELLRDAGAADAVAFDGGGSSAVVARTGAEVEVLSQPIHRHVPGWERPVAPHLGVAFEPVSP